MFSSYESGHFISTDSQVPRVLSCIMRSTRQGVKTPGTTQTGGRIGGDRNLGFEEDPERGALQPEFGQGLGFDLPYTLVTQV
jgi:hypothetical protein